MTKTMADKELNERIQCPNCNSTDCHNFKSDAMQYECNGCGCQWPEY